MVLTPSLQYVCTIGELTYQANDNTDFPAGQLLPVGKRVVEAMMGLCDPAKAGNRTVAEAALGVAQLLIEHWEFCTVTVYTKSQGTVKKQVEELWKRFKELTNWHQNRYKIC